MKKGTIATPWVEYAVAAATNDDLFIGLGNIGAQAAAKLYVDVLERHAAYMALLQRNQSVVIRLRPAFDTNTRQVIVNVHKESRAPGQKGMIIPARRRV